MWACTGAPRSMYWGPRSMNWAPLLCTEPAWAPLYVAGAARCTIGRCGQLPSRRRTMTAAALWRRLIWRRCTMAAGMMRLAALCGAVGQLLCRPRTMPACACGGAVLWAPLHTMVAPPHYGDGWCDAARCTMAALPMTALHYDGADGALL